jgi:hypothetical protein
MATAAAQDVLLSPAAGDVQAVTALRVYRGYRRFRLGAKDQEPRLYGVTLAMKNLFGLPPMPPLGRSRQYFHHIIRLSYILVDLARLAQPALSILDGLVAQSGREWGGDGRIADTLAAGDHVIATDACGTHLMGFDPLSDWPNQPFVRDRSSILIAHQNGFGTADLKQIDFQSEVQAPIAAFATTVTDPYETVLAWRRSTGAGALLSRTYEAEGSSLRGAIHLVKITRCAGTSAKRVPPQPTRAGGPQQLWPCISSTLSEEARASISRL